MSGLPASRVLRLGWWNTRLAPWDHNRHVFRNDPAQVTVANAVASQLARSGVNVLALGESTLDAARLVAAGTEYELVPDVRGWGLQVLHIPSQVQVVFNRQISAVLHTRETTRATELLVAPVGRPDVVLVFIVVHWPSRRMNEADLDRGLHAHCLQNHVNRLLKSAPTSDIVIGGDFNDDPWEPSMVACLFGTRDRSFAAAHDLMLYNPFFRFAGEHQSCDSTDCKTGAGTYHWSGGKTAHWWTFDQFLFSAPIVRGERWNLVESATGIWREPPMADALMTAKLFDHYPVIAGLAF